MKWRGIIRLYRKKKKKNSTVLYRGRKKSGRRESTRGWRVSGENEDKGGEEEKASFKWKWVRDVDKNRQDNGVSGTCSFLLLHIKEFWRQECKEKKIRRDGEEGGVYLTRRCALRESLPPTEVTLHVYVPMSPDQVWEMCRVPSASRRIRGMACTLIRELSFSQTCLQNKLWNVTLLCSQTAQIKMRHCWDFWASVIIIFCLFVFVPFLGDEEMN